MARHKWILKNVVTFLEFQPSALCCSSPGLPFANIFCTIEKQNKNWPRWQWINFRLVHFKPFFLGPISWDHTCKRGEGSRWKAIYCYSNRFYLYLCSLRLVSDEGDGLYRRGNLQHSQVGYSIELPIQHIKGLCHQFGISLKCYHCMGLGKDKRH